MTILNINQIFISTHLCRHKYRIVLCCYCLSRKITVPTNLITAKQGLVFITRVVFCYLQAKDNSDNQPCFILFLLIVCKRLKLARISRWQFNISNLFPLTSINKNPEEIYVLFIHQVNKKRKKNVTVSNARYINEKWHSSNNFLFHICYRKEKKMPVELTFSITKKRKKFHRTKNDFYNGVHLHFSSLLWGTSKESVK